MAEKDGDKAELLRRELAAESRRVQDLEHSLDVAMAEIARLSDELARARAIALVDTAGAPKEIGAGELAAWTNSPGGDPAAKLMQALLRYLQAGQGTIALPSADTEGPSRPEPQQLLEQPGTAEPVAAAPRESRIQLKPMRLSSARFTDDPGQTWDDVTSEFHYSGYCYFWFEGKATHPSVLLKSDAAVKLPYSAVRMTFDVRVSGYLGFVLEFRADREHIRQAVQFDSNPIRLSGTENGKHCSLTALNDDWVQIQIDLPVAGDQFPEVAIVPINALPYKRGEVISWSPGMRFDLGRIGLDFIRPSDSNDTPGRSGERAESRLRAPGKESAAPSEPQAGGRKARKASRPPVATLPSQPVLKGKLLGKTRQAVVLEERQALMTDFFKTGELERIEALRDRHKGKRAFIIGNGPSLAGQDLSLLEGEITFVANWFANHPKFDEIKPKYYAISSHEMFGGWGAESPKLNDSFISALRAHGHQPEFFFSYRFRDALLADPAMADFVKRYLIFDRPKFLADEVGGLQFDLAQPMHDGYTVLTTFCIPLAVHMGITEIYMVGCDCDYGITAEGGDRKYFYSSDKHATSSTSVEGILRVWADNGPAFQVYGQTLKDLSARGVYFANATDGGRLDVLPRVDFDELVRQPSMSLA